MRSLLAGLLAFIVVAVVAPAWVAGLVWVSRAHGPVEAAKWAALGIGVGLLPALVRRFGRSGVAVIARALVWAACVVGFHRWAVVNPPFDYWLSCARCGVRRDPLSGIRRKP